MLKTDYTMEVKDSIEKLKYEPDSEFLKKHQYVAVQYYTNLMRMTRGMLFFHTPGSGKTIIAEAIADYYRQKNPNRQIIVLTPKSLRENFVKTIRLYMQNNPSARDEEKSPEFVDGVIDQFKFISLGASNMYLQLERIEAEEIDAFLGDFLSRENIFENKLLIVDEMHNLSNAIANGSKNGLQFYDRVMATKNIKLIFMTATPMINSPFELVPIFNMLKGPMTVGRDTVYLLPELRREFEDYYVDKDAMAAKNGSKFKNRVYGMISYYGYDYTVGRLPGFPEQLPTIEVRVPMSDYQYAQYLAMREIEYAEESRKMFFSSNVQRFSEKSGASTSYRVRSRQVSNFAYPSTAFEKRGQRVIWHPERITKTDLKHIDKYSPKMVALLANLDQEGSDLIYTQFLPTVLVQVLALNGYSEYEPYGENDDGAKRFAIITGAVHVDRRDAIIRKWKEPENMNGELIKVLIITSTGAEGIDLKYGRRVHIFEPFWNDARHEQVIARIVRYGSHVDMPASKQNVQPYVYLSVHPKKVKAPKADGPAKSSRADISPAKSSSSNDEPTTDEKIWQSAKDNKKLILSFRKLLIEASIDCPINVRDAAPEIKDKFQCLQCIPNGAPLFHPEMYQDLRMPNSCIPPTYKKATVEEIEIQGEKLYFRFDANDKLYVYREIDGRYVQLTPETENYAAIAKAILADRVDKK